MKLFFISAVFGGLNAYNLRNRNTETEAAREPVVQIDDNIDDYGNVILRDYNSAFVSNGDSTNDDPDWSVTTSELNEQTENDQQISSEESEDFNYEEIQAPEQEPYLNSKFDKNRVWLNNNEQEWTPSEADQQQVEEDALLEAHTNHDHF